MILRKRLVLNQDFQNLDYLMNPGDTNTKNAIEVRELVRYYGNLLAVDHLSLGIRKGEVFGFLGPNGAGKTTSIHMMCGLLRPTSGEIFINGSN